MEADAIYVEKRRKLEVFCRCSPYVDEVNEASNRILNDIRALKILEPPDGKSADPACPVECIEKLYVLKTPWEKTYPKHTMARRATWTESCKSKSESNVSVAENGLNWF